MRILVTGGHGFLGKHLVRWLECNDQIVVAPTHADFDLLSSVHTQRAIGDTRPDVIVHLAAEVGGIGANQRNPGRYWYANLQMGLNVLEQARQLGVWKVVMVGTVCSYPESPPVPFREDSLWDGYPEPTNAPYGVAKKALLAGVQAYRAQYGGAYSYLLPANLYGPGDNLDPDGSHVIPALIRKMLEAQAAREREIVLWGDGSPTREFLFVKDCAHAIASACEMNGDGEPINLGTGSEVSILGLASMVADAVGFDGEIVWDTSRPNGQPRRCLDTSRARERLGFTARTSLREGLVETVAWCRSELGLHAPPATHTRR